MNALKSKFLFLTCIVISCLVFQCSSHKTTVTTNFEDNVPFRIKSVYFQEWFAGIDNPGKGYTLYVPVVQMNRSTTIEEVYFRNLKGKFHFQDGRYIAILKSPNKNYVFATPEKPKVYPFEIKPNECVITYTQDGQLKFYKTAMDKELAGTYYEHGVPSVYTRSVRSTLATVDEDDD